MEVGQGLCLSVYQHKLVPWRNRHVYKGFPWSVNRKNKEEKTRRSVLTENYSGKNGLSEKMLYSYHQLRYFVLFNHFEGTKCFQKSRTVPCYTEKILILAFNNNNVDKFMWSIFHLLSGNSSSILEWFYFYYYYFTINLQYWLDFTVDFIICSDEIIGNFILVECL